MATYTTNLRLKKIATGDESGTWGTSANNVFDYLDRAVGYVSHAMSDSDETITISDGGAADSQYLFIKLTGTLSAARTVTMAPNTIKKLWFINNSTTGGYAVSIAQGSGGTVSVTNGTTAMVYADGAGAGAAVTDGLNSVLLGALTVTGATALNGNVTVGNATGDALTFHPSAWTLTNAVTITGTWTNLGTVTTVDINGGTVDNAAIGGATPAAGAFTTLSSSGAATLASLAVTAATTLNGDTTIGNATGDALTFHPSAWTLTNAVTITGTWTNLGTVTTVDINGGTADNVAIGGSTPAAGAFTTLSSSGAATLASLAVTAATTLNGDTTIGNATGDALTFHPSAWTLTNAVTITGTWTNLGTVTTVDINGGTVDNAAIGGATPAAGAFTTLAASGNFAINTNKFTVTAASGNTVVAGTLGVTGALTVTSAGPHAIGGATVAYAGIHVTGAFTLGAGSSIGTGVWLDHDLTAATANTSTVAHLYAGSNSITTAGSSTTHGVVATVRLDEPNITVVGGDTVTAAATLYIANAPTEGTNNYALFVDAGNVRFDGLIESTVAAGSPVLKIAAGTSDTPTSSPETNAEAGWIEIQVGSDTRYVPFYT